MALPLIALGVGALSSIGQTIFGSSQARKARRAINNYQRQTLTNPYAGLQISRLGADLQTEQMARRGATTTKLLQGMGARGIFGGLANLEAQQQEGERQISADLDRQAKELEQMKAQGEFQRMSMQEQREQADLAGLGAQLSAGQQTMASGISGLTGLIGTGLMAAAENPDIFKRK